MLVVVVFIGATAVAPRVAAQPASAEVPLSFTAVQAVAGEAAYQRYCAGCHGEYLDDGEFAPPLKGADFRERWRSQTPDELFLLTSGTMPQDRPGSLTDTDYADLVAFIYQENGSDPGETALPADPERLSAWRLPGGDVSRAEGWRPAPSSRLLPREPIRWIAFER